MCLGVQTPSKAPGICCWNRETAVPITTSSGSTKSLVTQMAFQSAFQNIVKTEVLNGKTEKIFQFLQFGSSGPKNKKGSRSLALQTIT